MTRSFIKKGEAHHPCPCGSRLETPWSKEGLQFIEDLGKSDPRCNPRSTRDITFASEDLNGCPKTKHYKPLCAKSSSHNTSHRQKQLVSALSLLCITIILINIKFTIITITHQILNCFIMTY